MKPQYNYRWLKALQRDTHLRGAVSRDQLAIVIRRRRANGSHIERIKGGYLIGMIAYERIGEESIPKRTQLREEATPKKQVVTIPVNPVNDGFLF